MTRRQLLLPVGFLACALGLHLAPDARAQAPATTKPVPREQETWKKRHASFVARAQKGGVDVLFVGDSITQGWEGAGKEVWKERFEQFGKWKPANFGIGGDRTEHVLWRVTEGKELEGIDPKVIVLMIGTNNFAANTPEDIAAGVEAIVQEFRKQKPKAKVLLLGVFPRSGKSAKGAAEVPAADLHAKTKQVNALIAKLDDGKAVKYVDIGPKFLNDKGGLDKAVMPDFLHLSAEGYKIWADAIAPTVEGLMKD
jgi:lysophospholipase L1-like esterase